MAAVLRMVNARKAMQDRDRQLQSEHGVRNLNTNAESISA
jgi:hypothetical protein